VRPENLRDELPTPQGGDMNWDQVQGNWKQFEEKVRGTWGKFTDEELNVCRGTREQFVGKLQEKYGLRREDAEKELDEHLGKW
jgi:uncharacterized protein YjbJ (UPF0337 family)